MNRPSKEEIKDIAEGIADCFYDGSENGNTTQTETLKGIYEQLKKLKE